MFTSAECREQAEAKLAQAEHDDRHRRRLITAAQALASPGPTAQGGRSALASNPANEEKKSGPCLIDARQIIGGMSPTRVGRIAYLGSGPSKDESNWEEMEPSKAVDICTC
jgi:hypothetical protein